MSQQQIPSFQSWRPNSKDDILTHYYANSDGASAPKWLTQIQDFSRRVKAELANAIIPGSGKIIASYKIIDFQKISSSAKRRKQLDSAKEKQRIVDLYKKQYTAFTYPNNLHTKSDQEITLFMTKVRKEIDVSRTKCKKRDTAGCRWMGILNLWYQYGQFVLESRKALRGVSGTPQKSVANNSGSIGAPPPPSNSASSMGKGNEPKGIIGWILRLLGLN